MVANINTVVRGHHHPPFYIYKNVSKLVYNLKSTQRRNRACSAVRYSPVHRNPVESELGILPGREGVYFTIS